MLIHGWSCDRGYWDAQVEPLAEHYRVVTLDLIGSGGPRVDARPVPVRNWASELAARTEAW